ncbi:hypothetical protein CR513_13358, partial [Mucuna pruriens]
MKIALWTKTKLGFIDGTIKKLLQTSTQYDDWEKVDTMVIARIINSIDPSLHGRISHETTARDIELQPLLECACGVSKELTRREEDLLIHLFFCGLDGY